MVEHEEVRLRAGDVTLAGTLTLPPGEGRRPWVLLVGSWLPRDRDGAWDRAGHPTWFARDAAPAPGLLARLAGSLAAHGVASLRVDPRGCGESAGTWETTGLFTRIDDARDAIGAMRSRPELDLRRSAIVGHGEGAVVALSVAIADPAIGAVGLIGASARSARTVLRRGVGERNRTGADREHPVVAALDRTSEELLERVRRREHTLELLIDGADPVRLDLAGWDQAVHTPPIALATMLHREVVLIHGAEDAWADPEESRLLAAALAEAGNDPSLEVLPGVGHDLAELPDTELDRLVAGLVARMHPRDLPPVLVAIEELRG